MFFYLPSSCYVVKKPRKWYSLGNVSKPASHLTHRYLITKSIWRLIDAWQARNEVAYPWWCPQNSLVVVISWWNTGRTTEWEEKNIDRRKKMQRKKKKEKKMGGKKETANDSVLNWIAAPTHDCLTKGKSYIQVVGFIRLAAIATWEIYTIVQRPLVGHHPIQCYLLYILASSSSLRIQSIFLCLMRRFKLRIAMPKYGKQLTCCLFLVFLLRILLPPNHIYSFRE